MHTQIIENIKKWMWLSDQHEYEDAVRLYARLLEPKELEEILSSISLEEPNSYFAYSILSDELECMKSRMQRKEKSERELYRHNETVECLLKSFNNKKSGKVVEARKELQRRFFFLPYEEQLAVAKTLLNGRKTDRVWCYETLRRWWSAELEEPVLAVWNAYHEERCGWLLVKYFPIDTLKSNLALLDYDSNYHRLCLRLVKEDFFKVDPERLRRLTIDVEYLEIMSQTPEGISIDEVKKIIFKMICFEIEFGTRHPDPHLRLLMGRSDDTIVTGFSTVELWGKLFMSKTSYIERILLCMCQMGMTQDVLDFLKFDNDIHNKFSQLYGEEMEDFEDLELASEAGELTDLYARFLRFYASHIPVEYRADYYYLVDEKGRRILLKDYLFPAATNFEQQKQERPALKQLVDSLGLEVKKD